MQIDDIFKDLSTSMWIKDGKWHNSKPRVMSQKTIIVIQMTETGAFINSSEQQRWRKRLGCRIFQEVEQIFADGLDVVYKRIRDVKDNSKALGFQPNG